MSLDGNVNMEELTSHALKVEKYSFDCAKCGKGFPTLSRLDMHSVAHTEERPFNCDKCEKNFKSKNNLGEHLKRTHEGKKPYYCPICDRSYDGKVHQQVHSGLKPYKCKICSLAFAMPGNMRRHVNVHSNERPYPCMECSDSFKYAENLTTHVRRKHTKDPKVKCDNCSIQFITRKEMKSHWKRIHMELDKSVPCDKCDKTFRFEHDVRVHKKRVHVGAKNNICQICQKPFHTKMELRSHQRVHTEERPHKCSVCQLCFKTIPELEKHQITHTENKNYKCHICGKNFKRKASLQKHMQMEKAKESGEKSFQCEHCKKWYWTTTELKSHVNEFHRVGGPFTCPLCQKEIKTAKTLRLHIENHEVRVAREIQRKKAKNVEKEKFIAKKEKDSCVECCVIFKTKKLFKKHLLRHNKKSIELSTEKECQM